MGGVWDSGVVEWGRVGAEGWGGFREWFLELRIVIWLDEYYFCWSLSWCTWSHGSR